MKLVVIDESSLTDSKPQFSSDRYFVKMTRVVSVSAVFKQVFKNNIVILQYKTTKTLK